MLTAVKLLALLILSTQILQTKPNEILVHTLRTQRELNVLKCTNRFLNIYRDLHTHLVYSQDQGYIIDQVVKAMSSLTITEIKIGGVLPKVEASEAFVAIFVGEIKDLVYYLDSLYKRDRSVNYFVAYLGEESVEEVFKIGFRYYLTKLVVVDVAGDVYSYRPYEDGCEVVEPKLQFSCSSAQFVAISSVFDYELTSMHGCKVKAIAKHSSPYVKSVENMENPGFEMILHRTVANILNFTLAFVPQNFTDWGFKKNNGNYTDILKTFKDYKDVALCFGRLPARARLLSDFDATTTYFFSKLSLFLPLARPTNPFLNLINIFDVTTWVLIALAISTMYLTNLLIKKMTKTHQSASFLKIYGIYLTQSTKPPSNKISKYLYLVWVLSTLIITSSYSGCLVSLLTKPSYENQIKSIREIINSNFTLGGDAYSHYIIEGIPKLSQKAWIDCSDISASYCIQRLAQKRDLILIGDINVVRQYVLDSRIDGIKSIIYHMQHARHAYYVWTLVKRGHPLRKLFNRVVENLKQHGFTEKWTDLDMPQYDGFQKRFGVITAEQLLVPLYIYLAGIALSLIVFIWEKPIICLKLY